MRIQPPCIVKRNDGWYIVASFLASRYTFGPFDKPPQAEMEVWDSPQYVLPKERP